MPAIDATSLFDTPAPQGQKGLDAASLFGEAASAPTPAAKPAAPAEFSLADTAKSTLTNIAGVADMVLSLPGMAVGVGANMGTRIHGALKGMDRRQAAQLAAEVEQNVGGALSNPLHKLMGLFGYGEDYEASDVAQVMQKAGGLIAAGGDWTEKHTGGALLKEDVEALANAVMLAAGGRATAAGAQPRLDALGRAKSGNTFDGPYKGKLGKPAAEKVEPTADAGKAEDARTNPQGDSAAYASWAKRKAEADTVAATDKYRNTEQQAYSLMQKGASKGEVEAAIRKNPLLDEALAAIRGRREQVSEARSGAYIKDGPVWEEADLAGRGPQWKPGPAPSTGAQPELRGKRGQTGGPGLPLHAIALVGLGTAAALYEWEKSGEAKGAALAGIAGLTLADIGAKPATTPLAALLEHGRYTTKTLDRLPQNRFEFTREQVQQQLARPDVGKAEKEIIERVLGDKEKISAKDLIAGVKEATGDFELKAKESEQFADYGFENIDRKDGFSGAFDEILDPELFDDATATAVNPRTGHWEVYDRDGEFLSDISDPSVRTPEEAVARARANNDKLIEPLASARTTIYQSPIETGTGNHFSDPNYFAHARSFDEGGVRHVVELQSDLVQKAGKALSKEEVAALKDEGQSATRRLEELKKELEERPTEYMSQLIKEGKGASSPEWREFVASREKLRQERRDLEVRRSEIVSKIQASFALESAEPLRPIFKDWHKRLVREELAQAAEQTPGQPVRFATADTVAKVEGWPYTDWAEEVRIGKAQLERIEKPGTEDHPTVLAARGRLRNAEENLAKYGPGARIKKPEHQGIYDRYKRDVEKFLTKDLGGKPYTDSAGHTWIEVPPLKRPTTGRPGGPTQMFGGADPRVLARLAAIGIGATVGAKLGDDRLGAAVLGALGGYALTKISPRAVAGTIRAIRAKDPRASIGELADHMETNITLAAIDTANLQKRIESLVPEEGRRNAISHAIEKGSPNGLTPKEVEAYRLVREFYDSMARSGIDSGVLKAFRENYVTHLWDFKPEQRGLIDEWLDRGGAGGVTTKSNYAKARSVPTLAEGIARGLKPVTEDISAIVGVYSSSMVRAIEGAKMVDALKRTKTANGESFLLPEAAAPRSYVARPYGPLRGFRIHPDIAHQIDFLFDTGSSSTLMKAAQGVNDTLKRSAVSLSLFHAKALADAMVGGSSRFVTSLTDLKGFADGTNRYLKELERGSASSLVRDSVASGLKFSVEKGAAAVEDVGTGFYSAMKYLQKEADSVIPGSGKIVHGYEKLNQKLDTLMWARLHAGMKLSMWAEKRGQLVENSAKAHAKNPNQPILSDAEAGRIAASYANDLFGGLNWRKIAMDSRTRLGRDLAETVFNPRARRGMQLALFAPDWTISTTRAVLQAAGEGTGVRGLLSPTTLADLHRQYIMRSALYYFAMGNAINQVASGHYLWQNEDWTMIDLGDGRKMQWSKHSMEPVHWATKPAQQALNKLGFLPKEMANQLMGTEYLSPRQDRRTGDIKAGPQMEGSRMEHLLKNVAPIGLQQGITGDPDPMSTLAGMAGVPIYGKTEAQREAAKERRREKLEREREEREDRE
jgi:hypothetical protein